ncbi:MAG TPA: hypothetical protein VFQ62_03810 [Methylomirabilota bacterium]|nr:hypothetical protein [Methylomirabilota bacterium]
MTGVVAATTAYSLDTYRSLLELAQQQGYRFVSFLEAPDALPKSIYLRHDIDFSVTAAVELARVNAALGVQGTFFVLLRSEIYNVLSPRALESVGELRRLGQRLAFHCWAPSLGDRDALARAVLEDFSVLQTALRPVDRVFSWHNPSGSSVEGRIDLEVPTLVNAYGGRFAHEIRYVSDSNMRNSVADLCAHLRNDAADSLQLLLHPINWVVGGESVADMLAGAWRYVIRDREHGMRTNGVYDAIFPAGMSDTLVADFAEMWRRSAATQGQPPR